MPAGGGGSSPGGGGSSSVGTTNPACPEDPVVAGGPVGPCGTLSPLFHEVLGPLEHSVLDHAGPAGQHVAVDKSVPLSATSGGDLELARALLEVGVLPVMVTPIVDPEVGSSMTPAEYPVPPIPELSLVASVPLEVASPASPAGGSPVGNESL